MARSYLQIVGTPAVLRAQEHYYGRSRKLTAAAEQDPLGPSEVAFIAERDSFYMATVGESGWPYAQHRGGPTGFLRVLGPTTLAFADYEGNHQLVSTGNLAGDDRVSLFLMDYANRRRLKLLGHARIEDTQAHPDLIEQLAEPSRQAPGRNPRLTQRQRLQAVEALGLAGPPAAGILRGRAQGGGRGGAEGATKALEAVPA